MKRPMLVTADYPPFTDGGVARYSKQFDWKIIAKKYAGALR